MSADSETSQEPVAEGAKAAAKPLPSRAVIDETLRSILVDVLGLDADDVETFDRDTGLFGELPELDSMAVAGLLTEIEDRLEIVIEDDEVDGEMLETFGGLMDFIETKTLLD
ncbi:acyl carrier protein [Altererythrobacter lutimaris]|uniref:Acyl carrier protein n=1 Tax=Altererythrobacter lutimaris TaxID=2743979 RepID=A0A850H815_9SPHN|nr:acyl carrier protein [Altererythrobacter lutimaris]